MRRGLERPLGLLRALGAVGGAACRVGFFARRSELPDLVTRLRARDGGARFDPRLALGVLERLLPLLPPWGAGRCVKRSLILLDLWSRAGLEPRIHLGIRGSSGARAGHAWITTRDPALATERPPDVREAWSA